MSIVILDPSWSLNRIRIVDLPGFHLPDSVKGRVAYELISAQCLAQLVRERSVALQLDATHSDHELRLAFDACLESDAPSIREAASEVARIFGRRLGYVLLTLKRGDPINREARSEWSAFHWRHWGTIKHVWLGGGLVSGNLGRPVAHYASQVMREGRVTDFTLRVSPFAAVLPLIGAARHLPAGVHSAVVLDFGGTQIKRAQVFLKQDQIVELRRWPSLQAEWPAMWSLDETTPDAVDDLVDGMASIIADTRREARSSVGATCDTIPVCLAAYVKDGNPMTAQAGIYMQTNLITPNLESELCRRVGSRLKRLIHISLLHDGTAAATAYAGKSRAAVIMMGTALGIGFPGSAAGLRELSDDIVVH